MNFYRRVLLSLLCVLGTAGTGLVWADYVVDGARLVEAPDHQRIEGWLRELEEKTTAQVAVVTVPTTGQQTIEEYAVKLFQSMGVGQKKKDNGVLLVIAARDHKLRIEVGYGLEGALTDAISWRIINEIIAPEFKAGHFSQGVAKGVWAIVSVVAKEYNITMSGEPAYAALDANQNRAGDSIWFIIFLVVFVLFRALFLGNRNISGGYWYGGGYSGGGFGGGGGGFGGGFSGGGGMSGGGGASGGW